MATIISFNNGLTLTLKKDIGAASYSVVENGTYSTGRKKFRVDFFLGGCCESIILF